jgi:hypothetical protein
MTDISGSYRRTDLPVVSFEARQDGEHWRVIVKVGGEHFEQTTWQPSPWPCIEKLIGQALDNTNREAEPGKFDMNQPLRKSAAPVTSLRGRRKTQPGDLPEWRPPET